MPRRSSRPLLFAVSLLLLTTQAAGVAHELTARHAVCADHGEVVEAGAAAETAERAPEDAALWVGSDGSAAPEHTHCQLLATCGGPRPGLCASEVRVDLVATVDTARTDLGAWTVREPLFRLAPKSGPPQRG